MYRKIAVGMLVVALAAVIILFAGRTPDEGRVEAVRELDERLVEANLTFSFDLFRRLYPDDAAENSVVSPASISMALAMTYQGAGGETREAMAEALRYGDMDLAELNRASADLLTILSHRGDGVENRFANSLWRRQEYDFREDFMNAAQKYYGAQTSALDFSDPAASGIINDWVKDNTGGKIEEIVDEDIDPDTIMFIINALYFQGDWTEPFDESATAERDFHRPDGRSDPVPMMLRQGEMEYLERDELQAVRLPYGEEERMSMYVMLPSGDLGLDGLVQMLDRDRWTDWMDSFAREEGKLLLPRFTAEYEVELEEALTDMGMGVAFDDQLANFENMRPIPPVVYLKSVRHKTFVEVDETGTEAAAATSVEVGIESAPLEQFSMEVNRPFLFVIRDDVTETVLFMGTIADPE